MGEGIVRESGMDMDTLLYLTWRTNKDLLDIFLGGRRETLVSLAFCRGP